MTTDCFKCGSPIKNVTIINGDPYGTQCALETLGLDKMPKWFDGGDWNRAKARNDAKEKRNQVALEKIKTITDKYWKDYIRLSKANISARFRENEWEIKFIGDLFKELGFCGSLISDKAQIFDSFEEAQKNWKEDFGEFPYMYFSPQKELDDASPKELGYLEKIERNYTF